MPDQTKAHLESENSAPQGPDDLALARDEVKKKPKEEKPQKTLALHLRMMTLAPVKYVFAVIGHGFSMLALLVIFVEMILLTSHISTDQIALRVKDASNSALAFVFPDYSASLTAVSLDFNPLRKGWVHVSNIELLDVINERSISIKDFRFSPSIKGLFSGNFKFNYVGISNTDVRFKTAEVEKRDRFVYPINILDIPANIMLDGGQISIDHLNAFVTHYGGQELVAISDLTSSLIKTSTGYDAQISARHSDDASGFFSFQAQRDGEKIIWKGKAQDYKVTSDKRLGVDFDIDLAFDQIGPYDLTEKTDNIIRPYRYLTAGDGAIKIKFQNWLGEGGFKFDPTTKQLKIADMRLGQGDMLFQGEVDIKVGDEMLMSGEKIAVTYPSQTGKVNLNNLSFAAKLDLIRREFHLGEFVLNDQGLALSGKGALNFDSKLFGQLTLKSEGINKENAIKFWPLNIANPAYQWVSNSIAHADFKDVRFDALLDESLSFEISALGKNTVLTPAKFLPQIEAENVRVLANNKGLYVNADRAKTTSPKFAPISFKNILFFVDDFKSRPWVGQVNAEINGPANSVLTALSNEPINLETRIKMDAERFSGNVNGSLFAKFPMKNGTKLGDIELDVKSKIENFKLTKLLAGKDVTSKSLRVDVTERNVNIEGDVVFSGINAKASLAQSLNVGSKTAITATGRASITALKSIGVNLPSIMSGDNVGFDILIEPNAKGIAIKGDADIASLSINVPQLGEAKAKGTAGKLAFEANVLGSNIDISSINLTSKNLTAQGAIKVNSGKLLDANFTNVTWGDIYKGELKLSGKGEVIAKNAIIKLSSGQGVRKASTASNTTSTIVLDNATIIVTPKIRIQNATGRVSAGAKIDGDVLGKLGGNIPMQVSFKTVNGNIEATVTGTDAGGALRQAGLFGDLYGGTLFLKIRTTDQAGLYAGRFAILKTNLSNSRTAVQLLQAASIFGLLDQKGIKLDEIGGDILLNANEISLFSGHAFGPSIGLTLGGNYKTKQKQADFVGVLTPAYLVNGAFQKIPALGELLSGNVGEGVFGVSYAIKGGPPHYQIQANPFSLLTPGKFRELWGNVPQSRTIPEKYRVR